MREDRKDIKDRYGNIIKEGSVIGFFYINPVGELTDELLEDESYRVVFNYGTLGYYNHQDDFVSLFDYLDAEKGQYCANYGHKTILKTTASAIKVLY